MKGKVQIPVLLFNQMILYIMNHADPSDLMYKKIMQGIEQKMEAVHRHNLYTMYKTEHDPENKELAR